MVKSVESGGPQGLRIANFFVKPEAFLVEDDISHDNLKKNIFLKDSKDFTKYVYQHS